MSWHHAIILATGIMLGGCLAVIIMGLFAVSGEQSRAEEGRVMQQGDTPSNLYGLDASRPHPASACAVPKLR